MRISHYLVIGLIGGLFLTGAGCFNSEETTNQPAGQGQTTSEQQQTPPEQNNQDQTSESALSDQVVADAATLLNVGQDQVSVTSEGQVGRFAKGSVSIQGRNESYTYVAKNESGTWQVISITANDLLCDVLQRAQVPESLQSGCVSAEVYIKNILQSLNDTTNINFSTPEEREFQESAQKEGKRATVTVSGQQMTVQNLRDAEVEQIREFFKQRGFTFSSQTIQGVEVVRFTREHEVLCVLLRPGSGATPAMSSSVGCWVLSPDVVREQVNQ